VLTLPPHSPPRRTFPAVAQPHNEPSLVVLLSHADPRSRGKAVSRGLFVAPETQRSRTLIRFGGNVKQ
jgi:hypothetical protein